MVDHSDYGPANPLKVTIKADNAREIISAPVEQIVADRIRNDVNEGIIAQLMETIPLIGLTSPIIAAKQQTPDGEEKLRLISGRHRLEAMKRLRIATIPCMVLDVEDALSRELVEIEENFARRDLSAAEHALLLRRRDEIRKQLAEQQGTLSQSATASKQAQRRAGQKTGHDPGSVRDEAKRTGVSKDKIHRSKNRFETLGPAVLESVMGTTLDAGTQLDALMKLPAAVREDLVKRASDGEVISARKVLHEAKGETQRRRGPKHVRPTIDAGNCFASFRHWQINFSSLDVVKNLKHQILELDCALWAASCEEVGTDPEEGYFTLSQLDFEEGEARPTKTNWRDLRSRKGD